MRSRIFVLMAAAIASSSAVARAEQFVLVDVTYTHSTATTNDSHYYPMLPANTPEDWTSPVDYSKGSVHIVVDVKTKPPGDAPTKFQICFEGTPMYGCTTQSPTYTKTGKVEWDSPFSSFWYPVSNAVDWSQGVKKVPLILKDDDNGKPHGQANYMPTDLHVQVTLVSAGSTFVPPPAAGSGGAGGAAAGAGAGGRGGSGGAGSSAAGAGAGGAGAGGQGGVGSAAAGWGGSAAGGGGGGGKAGATAAPAGSMAVAGSSGASGSPAAGAPAASSGAAGTQGTRMDQLTRGGEEDSGCRVSGTGSGSLWAVGVAIAWLASRRRSVRGSRR